jgi:hypothetical protein
MTSQWSTISTKNKAKMLGAVKKTVKAIGKDVIKNSPVDTGRFKGNWNAALNAPNLAIDLSSGAGLTEIANKIKIGDVFFFTNNLPYALRLEFGWSDQSPNGMVRLAVAKFPFTVNKITTAFINKPVIPL